MQAVTNLHSSISVNAKTETDPRKFWKGILAGMKEEGHKEVIHGFIGLGFVYKETHVL